MPVAMSFSGALLSALPKLEAVASRGRLGSGWLQMSFIWRLMFAMSPSLASSTTWWMSCDFSIRRESPCAFYLDEGRSRTHADRYQAVESALVLGSQGIGDELVRLGRRPSVQGGVDVGTPYTGQNNLFDVLQVELIVVQVFPECSEERGDGVCSSNEEWGLEFSVFNTDNFGSASAYIDAKDNSHIRLSLEFGTKIRNLSFKNILSLKWKYFFSH